MTHNGWLILIALYISFIGRIILKDFRDVKGDAKFGKRTFILRHGRGATCLASALGLTIGSTILLAVIPHVLAIVTTFEVLLICTLWGLYRLYQTAGHNHEQVIISAIVRTAGGAVITLLAVLLAQNNGKSLSEQTIIVVGLGCLFVAMFWDTIKKAEKLKAGT
jgi:4-hydroxybenzoate polyprenyltransferase